MDARWIIETKFDPPRQHSRQIERRHLVDRLVERAGDPIIVQAAAGFGKSTLLAQWAWALASSGTAVAWLNLDEDDGQVDQFVAYVVEAFRRALGDAAERETIFSAYAGLSPKAALALMLNEVARRGRPVALVLDDYHRAENDEIDALMRGLLERTTPLVRIAIATRTQPRLGLTRLKVENRLVLVTDRELRFNEGETSLFLAADMPRVDHQDWVRFASLAEGWPVALQFARMWLGEGGDLAALSAASDVNDLGAYLSEQVFGTLSADQRDFLLRTSPFEIISEEIAEAIGIERSGVRVRELARSALPITILSPEPVRFRYHHLLQDFLLARARADGVDLAAIHRRAARHFAASSDLASAVRHALAGGDPDYAAAIVEKAGGWRLVYSGEGHLRAILRTVYRVLGERASAFPRLVLGNSALAAKSGDLAIATELFRQVAEHSDRGALADEIAIIDALILLYCDQPLPEPALAALVELTGRLTDADPIGLALATNLVAFFMLQKGDYLKARRFGERAVQIFRRAEAAFGEIHLYVHIGEAELATGNRSAAAATYRTMRDLCVRALGEDSDLEAIAAVLQAEAGYEADERAEARRVLAPALNRIERADGWFDVFAAGYLTAARLELADHGPAAAFAAIERGRRTVEARRMARLGRLLDEEAIRIATLAGDLEQAAERCRRIGLALDPHCAERVPPPVSALRGDGAALILARLLVALGEPEAALVFLDAADRQMLKAGAPLSRRITARVLKAFAEDALDRRERALASLLIAVKLAAPERFVRTLLDEGERFRDLVAEVPEAARIDFASRIDRLQPTPSADPPLSARERQILDLLAEGLSNKEIARRLEIDPNTVKYHLKRLFAKLAVERRGRAVARARQFGLID